MRISVAMATYNGARYLGEQLDSILSQLGTEDEVILSDDGSADGTVELIEEYAAKDSRIRKVTGPGNGVIANFEYAISLCEGDVIFLADQDDRWMPDKVRHVMDVFEAKPDVVLVMHDARVMTEDLEEVMMPSFFAYRGSKAGVMASFVKNSYMGCCMAFRRKLVEKALPIPKDLPMHDQWIGLISDKCYGKSYLMREQLLLYRRHPDAVSDFDHNSVWIMIRNRLMILGEFCKRIHMVKGNEV